MSEKTIEERAMNWIVNGRVGTSSRTIWSVMMTGRPPEIHSHPHDLDDFNRCLSLLNLIPERRNRLSLMRGVSKHWDVLVDRWEEIEKLFLEEAGLDWSKGINAPQAGALMRSTLYPLYAKGCEQ